MGWSGLLAKWNAGTFPPAPAMSRYDLNKTKKNLGIYIKELMDGL